MILKKFFLTGLILGCGFCEQINGSQHVWQQAQTWHSYIQERLQKAPFVARASRCVTSGLNFCKTYPGTTCLIAANLGVFAAQKYYQYKAQVPVLEMKFGQLNSAVKQGEWWRLFTGMFLHDGLLHFIYNTSALLQCGPFEQIVGSRKFLGFYMASGILANILSYKLGKPETLSVGASGALYGTMAAFYGRAIQRGYATHNDLGKALVVPLVGTALLSGAGTMAAVDNVAHIGGFASGYALGRIFSD